MSDDDPFACFDDDDDDSDDANATSQPSIEVGSDQVKRDPNNGILVFHAGTEQALLHYVYQRMENGGSKSLSDQAAAVLGHINDFSVQRHWMMHVGEEKGSIITDFLMECVESKAGSPVSVVEIGTYCGYSSILLAKALQSVGCDFKICSVEVVESNAKVAKKMIELAGLADRIQVLLMDPTRETLEGLLKHHLKPGDVDFLFVDHDKSQYLRDLQDLESSGLIKKGCFVAADNVIFAQIDDYRQYVSELHKSGTVRTRLAMSWLEYSEPDHNDDVAKKNMMKDGIGKYILLVLMLHLSDLHPLGYLNSPLELTVYLKDP